MKILGLWVKAKVKANGKSREVERTSAGVVKAVKAKNVSIV